VAEKIAWNRHIDYGAIGVVAVLATSVLGQMATYPNLAPWYAGLVKPSFNPPNWIFAPVWSALYLLMAFAVWRTVRQPASRARFVALTLFFAQLALNAAWSWLFFASHSPLLGLIDVVPQFFIIVAAVIAFVRLDWMAALALLPLAAWVGFASVLNYAIWQLNG
jgi:tryptophan-rich sensory protein